MYTITFSDAALADIKLLKRNEPRYTKKLISLIEELKEHPRTGTGQAERLKHYEGEVWSRRISQKHRLVYKIIDNRVEVLVLSAYGHY